MSAERVVQVNSTGIEIAYERLGDPDAPPVLLVMGVAAQMIHWPDGFCHALVARGLHVIRSASPARPSRPSPREIAPSSSVRLPFPPWCCTAQAGDGSGHPERRARHHRRHGP